MLIIYGKQLAALLQRDFINGGVGAVDRSLRVGRESGRMESHRRMAAVVHRAVEVR